MINSFNLGEILYFPFRDRAARMQFLYVSLAILAGFIIPLLPMIAALGYVAQIMTSIIKEGREPHMPEWKDPGKLFMEGLRLYGLRIIYITPLILGMLVVFVSFFASPALLASNEAENSPVALLLIFLPMLCMIPLGLFSLLASILMPVAECHMLAQDKFSAGFQVGTWWKIFWTNIGQFLLAFVIIWVFSMALSLVMQVLIFTIVLACLLPILMPVISAYLMLVSGAVEAVAYRNAAAFALQTEDPSPA